VSKKDPQFFRGCQIFCESRSTSTHLQLSAGLVCKQTLQ